MSRIGSLEALRKSLRLTADELAWHEDSATVPLAITEHFLSLINPDDPDDPLRRQVVPTCAENTALACEDMDPQEEERHSVGARLVHRYADRVAFLVTDICPMYCRHCFRRRFTGNLRGPASADEVREAEDYLKSHREVKEMLLTGGDVLTLGDEQLDSLIGRFREVRPDLILRLCTRYPSSEPSRITRNLVEMLKRHDSAPVFILTQFNHPRELCAESRKALGRFVDAGFPVFNQSVLLKGVNDDSAVLAELCDGLLACRVKPYYLFQVDLVSGASGFRVPLERGIEIYKELSEKVSGLALPVYSIDLPHGGGKVSIGTASLSKGEAGEGWLITTPEGRTFSYPAD